MVALLMGLLISAFWRPAARAARSMALGDDQLKDRLYGTINAPRRWFVQTLGGFFVAAGVLVLVLHAATS